MNGILAKLARIQLARPWLVLLVALISVLVAARFAAELELRTSLGELLPENKESVIVAERINARLPAMSTLTVIGEGSDDEGLKRFVDALAMELAKLPAELVGGVDHGKQAARRFVEEQRVLFAPLSVVQQVHDEIVERYDYEIAVRAGTLLDDDDPPPPLTEASIRQRLEEAQAKSQGAHSGPALPDGYYLDQERHFIALRVMTPIGPGELHETEELTRRVKEAIDRVEPGRYDASLRVGLTGDLLTSAEAYQQIKGDLAHVGLWGVSLILGVVLLYYLRLRMLLAMALTVGVGTVWTFGLAYLWIGHLNSSTGFLVSILVGNGINFGILYMARYLEARRRADVAASIALAHRETWAATLTAAAAASAAYGALLVTDFRGFKQFGVIGGSGMLMCWMATFLVLPPILIVSERVLPIPPPSGVVARLSGVYGRPFAALVARAPRSVLLIATLVTAAAGVLAYRYVAADPMEYDMNRIDNEKLDRPSEVRRLQSLAGDVIPRTQDGLAIGVDRLDQVLPLKRALEARRHAAPPDQKPFEAVVTIHDLLPTDQGKKIALIAHARDLLERARGQRFIGDDDWRKIDELLPTRAIRELGIGDLPDQMVEPFVERDGTRGRLVYIVPTSGRSVWDGRYLLEWADSFRSTELPDGSVILGSGRAVIYADMLLAVVEDAPRAIVTSLALTLLIVLVSFRGRTASAWVIGSVLVGLVWAVAVLAIWNSRTPWSSEGASLEGLKLNFLNFVALPITIGVGADYAVNVMKRCQSEGGGDIRAAIAETGGAVILCSLTTTLGYLALTRSVNLAIRSFGVAAATGEICCLLVAVVVMPAGLWLVRRRREATADAPAPSASARQRAEPPAGTA